MHQPRMLGWRRLAIGLAAAVPVAWVIAAVPTAAEASIAQCPASSFCMWQNYSYNNYVSGGFWYYRSANYAKYQWYYVGDGANDKATSIYNFRSYKTGINKNVNPPSSTDKYCLAANYQNGNLVENNWPDGTAENDTISGFWFSGSSSSCGSGF